MMMATAARHADDDGGKQAGTDAKQCPWCSRWALKDEACNWVCCGLVRDETTRADAFMHGMGCGRQWCFHCGKRLCTLLYSPDGPDAPRLSGHVNHTHACCSAEAAAHGVEYGTHYCPGGHNSHK